MKVAVMTDSTAYIPAELRKKWDIHMVPLSVVFDDTSYLEEVDITPETFYQKIKESETLPTTSQPSVGVIVDKLEELSTTYDAVISIHLSSGISGTYQAVIGAGQMVDNLEVFTFDSELSAMAQGLFVLKAAELAREQKTPTEIINYLNEMKDKVYAYFMVDDLTNLKRGGRLSHAQAVIGSLLNIKPVLHFVDKVIVPFEKIRTRKKALKRIIDMLETEAEQGVIEKVVFIHGNDPETAAELCAAFEKKYPTIETIISYFGPVIGTHLGEKSIGVAWLKK